MTLLLGNNALLAVLVPNLLFAGLIPRSLMEKRLQTPPAFDECLDRIGFERWNACLLKPQIKIIIFAGNQSFVEKRLQLLKQSPFDGEMTGGDPVDTVQLAGITIESSIVIMIPKS